jgi:protoporphyrinogen oxidase/ubiquinone/menaquinone biosynthesis C-methylase UbiE
MRTREALSNSWAIVGGGILGMTLACRLAQAGRSVKLFEGAPVLGGLASSWKIGDVLWDRHYHVTLLSDLHLRGLLAEVGLEKNLRWKKTRTAFFSDGGLYSMSDIRDYLRFRPLRPWDKVRLGATVLRASRLTDLRELEHITALEWLTKLSGERTVEKLWRPLLASKLGMNTGRVSAAFIQATITRLYAARNSGLKEEMFGYLPGGYPRINAALAGRLSELGVEILPSHALRSVHVRPSGGLRLVFHNAHEEVCENAVLTVPAPSVATLCPQLSEEERQAFHNVEYQGILCASALLTRPLSDYYVTNLTDGTLPFTGIVDVTALVDPEEFGGRGLVYLPKYVSQNDPAWSLSDGDLQKSFENGLSRVYPAFRSCDVLAFRVSRVRDVFALPLLDYSRRLPPMRTSVAGLFAISSAHIVHGTFNVNETVSLANRAAAWLLAAEGRPAEARPPEPEGWVRYWAASPAIPLEHRRAELRSFLPALERVVGFHPEDVVLDIGSGPGLLAERIAGQVKEVHNADVSPTDLNLGRVNLAGQSNVHFHLLDSGHSTRLDALCARRFSLIVCRSVVQYYRTADDVADLIMQIRRVSAPGARLIIIDIPTGATPLRDTLDLLWHGLKEGRLPLTLGFLLRTGLSSYSRVRRKHGLLCLSATSLVDLLKKLDLEGEVLSAGLTPFSNRLHLLVRFSDCAAGQKGAARASVSAQGSCKGGR